MRLGLHVAICQEMHKGSVIERTKVDGGLLCLPTAFRPRIATLVRIAPLISPTAAAAGLQELVRAMTEPRNAVLRQYQALLARHGARLSVTDGAQRSIAAEARRRGTGARGLRSLLEDLLLDARFEAPRHAACDVVLDADGAPRPALCLLVWPEPAKTRCSSVSPQSSKQTEARTYNHGTVVLVSHVYRRAFGAVVHGLVACSARALVHKVSFTRQSCGVCQGRSQSCVQQGADATGYHLHARHMASGERCTALQVFVYRITMNG